MNPEKINLIIKNMELLIESLKLEIKEEKEDLIDTYEPDYYEER